jgi:hypothetical protein
MIGSGSGRGNRDYGSCEYTCIWGRMFEDNPTRVYPDDSESPPFPAAIPPEDLALDEQAGRLPLCSPVSPRYARGGKRR